MNPIFRKTLSTLAAALLTSAIWTGTTLASHATEGLPSQASADGTSVQITGVRQAGNRVAVDYVAVNSVVHAVNLNFAAKSSTRLRDSTGKVLALAAPADNKMLVIQAGETVKSTIFFEGAPAAEAKNLCLEINKDVPPAKTKEYPGFALPNLPLPTATEAN